MRKTANCLVFVSAAVLASHAAAAVEYYGYLTVNDEDYGYWQGQPMAYEGGKRTPLDELASPISEALVFELSHDLAQGLVRQFVSRPAEAAVEASAMVSEIADAAGVDSPSQPPEGQGSWVRFGKFQTLGFGQYEDSDATYGVYCERNPSTWVWLAGESLEGLSPDDAANRVLADENGMARLKLGCEGAMEVSR